ncbi:aminopeptidase P family N-terminal domain-containing protein [Mesorhizobium silamurunense]|uniref:aminopeptidase P family N-terminal domain-containing protein n=1 Tax=Mesorhizobium silamurunense TaxID=499528 RepID=UPI003CCE5445
MNQQEYRESTARLRQQIAARGMDALLVMSENNMNYLTGYDGYSEYVPQLALVSQDDEDPWLILREIDTLCATPTSSLPEARILSYPTDPSCDHASHPHLSQRWNPGGANSNGARRERSVCPDESARSGFVSLDEPGAMRRSERPLGRISLTSSASAIFHLTWACAANSVVRRLN